jgi:hypothetical protein
LSISQERKWNAIAYVSYRLDIDNLKVQEEETLIVLSGSENNSISNIKLTIPMYIAMIQRTSKSQGARIKRKGLSLTSLLNTTY